MKQSKGPSRRAQSEGFNDKKAAIYYYTDTIIYHMESKISYMEKVSCFLFSFGTTLLMGDSDLGQVWP